MFRCITELKGLAVDIDSFSQLIIPDWVEINSKVACVFLTTNEATSKQLEKHFSKDRIVILEKFGLLFSPNKSTHTSVLDILGIQNTELAYLSCNLFFLDNASSFLSGTIWINETVSYQDASKSPDIILDDVNQLKEELNAGIAGYYGEMSVFPNYRFKRANMLPVSFNCDDEEIPLYVLGRYYPNSHYLSQLHPYSIAIRCNKIADKKYTGAFDSIFSKLYSNAINNIKVSYGIDCVCSVPVKPGKTQRFAKIIDEISKSCNITNIEANFECMQDYPDQKTLSATEREENVKGVFRYTGKLNDNTVVLLDDISSTGSTIKECIRELKRCGAKKVVVILLAINQSWCKEYWSSDYPMVICQTCGGKMTLTPNRNGNFFFSCYTCYKAGRSNILGFHDGWKQLYEAENDRFKKVIAPDKKQQKIDNDDESFDLSRLIQCPFCESDNRIDLFDFATISSHERSMGPDSLFEFNERFACTFCHGHFWVKGHISFYPHNSFESERIDVTKDIDGQ